jgi:hypothetical protein
MIRLHPTITATCLLATAIGLASTTAIGLTSTSAHALDRRIRLINKTDTTIGSFYSSNVDSGHWGRDLLGQYVVPPGHSIVVDLNNNGDDCSFDLRTVMEDGTEIVRGNVNVCTAGSYEVE